MMKVVWVVLMSIVFLGMIGCATPKDRGEPTMHDVVACVQMLIGNKMVSHPEFLKNYSAVKASRKDKLPIVCLLPIRNDTSSTVLRTLCRPTDNVAFTTIFDAGLFGMVDDDAAGIIKSRIIWSADGGIENANELMAELGEHNAPDFIVTGAFFGDDVFYLRLTIHNLHTSSVVWTGFVEIEPRQ